MPSNKTSDALSNDGRVVISAPLVLKPFRKKNDSLSELEEWYLQRSIQDYYIKFCESEVSRSELETYLKQEKDPLNTAKLEVEFREGEWDRCDETEVQSRVGAYVVIYQILSSK